MNNTIVDSLSKTTAGRRDQLFRWLSSQGEATRLEAVKLQGDLAAQHRPQYDKTHRVEFFYSMLVLALAKMEWAETVLSRKEGINEEELKQLTARRVERIKATKKHKPSPKRELIRIRFYEEIKRLKTEGLSWRQIALYIKTYHKKIFTHTYLRDTFKALEKELRHETISPNHEPPLARDEFLDL